MNRVPHQSQKKPTRRRRRGRVLTTTTTTPKSTPSSTSTPSASESESESSPPDRSSVSVSRPGERPNPPRLQSLDDKHEEKEEGQNSASASDEEDLDEMVRNTNAYPGATNSVGSIHQRRWFLSLDRVNSGFGCATDPKGGSRKWVRRKRKETEYTSSDLGSPDGDGDRSFLGFEPFYVRGPAVERSVVTGRTGGEVLAHEDVEGFVPRKGWRAVLE